jgi:hypothetical protein
MKIKSAILISGSTSSLNNILDAEAHCEIRAEDINHRQIPALIGAASDLLEACKQSLITLDPMDNDHADLYRLLADAITKAEGYK